MRLILRLLLFLAELMKAVDFDLQEFQRILLNTRTYQRQVSVTPEEGQPYRFPGPVLRRMTAEQTWDSLVLLFRGEEIDRLKTDHAPKIERLVFPLNSRMTRKVLKAIVTKSWHLLIHCWTGKFPVIREAADCSCRPLEHAAARPGYELLSSLSRCRLLTFSE